MSTKQNEVFEQLKLFKLNVSALIKMKKGNRKEQKRNYNIQRSRWTQKSQSYTKEVQVYKRLGICKQKNSDSKYGDQTKIHCPNMLL